MNKGSAREVVGFDAERALAAQVAGGLSSYGYRMDRENYGYWRIASRKDFLEIQLHFVDGKAELFALSLDEFSQEPLAHVVVANPDDASALIRAARKIRNEALGDPLASHLRMESEMGLNARTAGRRCGERCRILADALVVPSKTARMEFTEQGLVAVKKLTDLFRRAGWEADHGSVQQGLRDERFRWIKRFVNPQMDLMEFEDSWASMSEYRRGQVSAKYGVRPDNPDAKELVYAAMQRRFADERDQAGRDVGAANRILESSVPGASGMGKSIPARESWMYVLEASRMLMQVASSRSADSLIGPMQAEDVDAEAGPKVGPPEMAQPLRSRRDYGCVSCRTAAAIPKERIYFEGDSAKPGKGDEIWADMTDGKRADGEVEDVKGEIVVVTLGGKKGQKYHVTDFKKSKKASFEWVTAAEVRDVCPACADKMAKAGVSRVKRSFFEKAVKSAERVEGMSERVARSFAWRK